MAERVGPHLVELALPASPGWARAGFSIHDGRIPLANTTLRVSGSLVEFGLDRTAAGHDASWLGIPLNVIETPPMTDATPSHLNSVVSLDHVVVMTPHPAETVAAIAGIGWEVRREREATMAGIEVVQRFVWAGRVLLEIVTPTRRNELIRAPHVWGVTFTTSNLDAAMGSLGDACGGAKDAVQPGRRIATLRRKLLELPLEVALMSPIP